MSNGIEALERRDDARETTERSDDVKRGNTSSAMTFTDGAQATTMAMWFSTTEYIIALAKRSEMVRFMKECMEAT